MLEHCQTPKSLRGRVEVTVPNPGLKPGNHQQMLLWRPGLCHNYQIVCRNGRTWLLPLSFWLTYRQDLGRGLSALVGRSERQCINERRLPFLQARDSEGHRKLSAVW